VLLGWLHRDTVPVQSGLPAPAFGAPSLRGDTLQLESLRGKVVLLNAWATWCEPCRWEMPAIERLYQQYGSKGLVVVAVSQDQAPGPDALEGGTLQNVASFVAQNGLTFPVLLDPRGRLQQLYGIVGLPTTFIIDRQGRIVRKVLGPARWDEPPYSREIQRLLGG
ncbi:MAG TPA: TlpA disulfide reductase family protein, partial [Longimicrobiales bacterium]